MLKKLVALLLALCTALAFAAVDVNSADATQLDGVKGIGPSIAGKISAERKKGPFKDWDDLINRVGGIGEKSAAQLSEGGLTVNGRSFKGMAPAAPKAPAKADTKADAKPAATAAATPPATAPAAAPSAEDKKAAAKKAREEKAAAKKKEAEDKAAAKKAKDDAAKDAKTKAKTDKATASSGKASEPSAKK